MLERIASLQAALGDDRDMASIRRDVLTRSIFGVDVNPTAVWLCGLRLWLSVVIESADDDVGGMLPLPNLDRNIRVGDALGERDTRRGGPCRGSPPRWPRCACDTRAPAARERQTLAAASGTRRAPARDRRSLDAGIGRR